MRGDVAAPEFVDANGVRIHYSLEGPADAPVLLFSNSLATDLELWDAQAAHFAGTHRILRYDTRGHGASAAPPAPYSIEQLAGDAIALLDALDIARVTFIGISLGGMVGQVLGARHEDRIDALVLSDTAMRMNRQVWESRVAQVKAEGLEPLVAPTLARWFTEPFRAAQPAEMRRVGAMIRRTAAEGYMGCAAAIRDMQLEALAFAITRPTLLMVGAEDTSTTVADARALQAVIPGAELAVLPDAAHLPNIEQAGLFNQTLERFLARQKETGPAAARRHSAESGRP